MHDPGTRADYESLARSLRRLGVASSPSEVHGILTGMLASSPAGGEVRWRALILERGAAGQEGPAAGQSDDVEAAAPLEALLEQTREHLERCVFGFEPLLAGEDTALPRRVQALAEWCRGFLLGLVAGGVKDMRRLTGEAGEAVRDMLEIAEAELGQGEVGEAAERDFVELVEYVRAAVQIIYEELHP